VVGLEVADFTEPELRQEILKLRRRLKKLTALLRLTLSSRQGPNAELRLHHDGAPMKCTSGGNDHALELAEYVVPFLATKQRYLG